MNIEKLSGIVQGNSVLLACILRNLDKLTFDRVERDMREQSEEAISHFLATTNSEEAIDAMREQLEKFAALMTLIRKT
ncbi:MAG: hypothetical protein EPN57_20465 [Paraburkholderia sp.]|nr:MAG: hypothetical protein EPN57_20465 [Paraburkholderia sp.]